MAGATLTVHVRPTKRFRLRLKAAILLIQLAAFLMKAHPNIISDIIEIDYPETTE